MNMDWMLEPPEPSHKERCIEAQVEDWMKNPLRGAEEAGLDLEEYLDWGKLEADFAKVAEDYYDSYVDD